MKQSILCHSMLGIAALSAATVSAATPEVTSCSMRQDNRHREVTIQYTFTGADAVITLDVETNYLDGAETKWASIGGEAIRTAHGDVWKKVANDGQTHTITWRPDLSWPDHRVPNNGARAVVTAWALDNTPDYMVVDISETATQDSQKYYPSADFVPGGVVENEEYRTTKILMRKIMAKDVAWTMGSLATEAFRDGTSNWLKREATHEVTMANNYYIGVFEFTQGQYAALYGSYRSNSYFTNPVNRHLRPQENISWTAVRGATSNLPGSPASDSVIGKINLRTGLDFELPTEAQWEFACRAGNGSPYWNDGTAIVKTNDYCNVDLDRLGRYAFNGGGWARSGNSTVTVFSGDLQNSLEYGTAPVGSYEPNSWGIYDMLGNVFEYCLDWIQSDWSVNPAPNGAANVSLTDGTKTYNNGTPNGEGKVARGGSYKVGNNPSTWRMCRPAASWGWAAGSTQDHGGFRLVCTAGLE